MPSQDELRARVSAERERRGFFSGRAAADAAGELGAEVSYTTWNDWENGRTERLGIKMRRAVMVLFDWPHDWPERLPDEVSADSAEGRYALRSDVDELEARVKALEQLLGVSGGLTDEQFTSAAYEGGPQPGKPKRTFNRPSPPAEDGPHLDE